MTLAVVTAAVLAVVLVVALLVVLGFLFEIRRLLGGTADAMEDVTTGSAQLAGHLSGLQRNTSAASAELPADRT